MSVIIDGSNGLTFPNSTVQASAGQVLQVVNATYGTQFSSSSSTFADSGLTVSITPKFATSKILVTVNITGLLKDTNNAAGKAQIVRNSTAIYQFEGGSAYTGDTSASACGGSGATYLDSPATTSATTYKVQFASTYNNVIAYMNAAFNGGASPSSSSITVMEIAQ